MPAEITPPQRAYQGTGKGKRLRETLVFASSLEKRLATTDLGVLADDEYLDELRSQVQTLHMHCRKPRSSADSNEEMERLGTAIWNLSTRVMRDAEGHAAATGQRKTVIHSRIFAFHLLDAAQYSAKAGCDDLLRLMRLALKGAKSAIDNSEFELAAFVLQKSAEYVGRLTDESHTPSNLDEAKDIRGLEAEYYILRTALSWKENRLDVAEHMYNKGHPADNTLEPQYAEKLADVLYEIGKDMAAKKDFQMAAKWMERAHNTINSLDLEQLSREALELRTAIIQARVSTLLNLESSEALQEADNLIGYMQSEMGNTMVVLILRLEFLEKTPPEVFDSDAYAGVLGQMIRSLIKSDSDMDPARKTPKDPGFKLISHHIGKLHARSPTLGCGVLDKFILAIVKTPHDDWMERLVTRRIWMAGTKGDLMQSVEAARVTLSQLKTPLRAEATIAAQTLIWKALESVYNQKLFNVAEQWCQLALHPIFVNSGPQNKAKIERKYLLCAIYRNDLDGAISIHHSMAEATKQDPRTWYLMYKVAVRNSDIDLATACLEGISRAPEPLEYLYACCIEATSARHKQSATESLVKLLEANQHASSSPVHLPALLRCVIRLFIKDFDHETDEEEKSKIVERLCDAFDQVVSNTQREVKDVEGKKLFDIKELDWFGRNAYNLALQNVATWDVSHTIKILTACIAIMSQYPPDISSDVAVDLKLKALFSNFIIATALLARARAKDDVESQLQDYLQMRKHIAAFDSDLPAQLPALVGQAREDMLQKLATLLAFDFEGAVRLKDFDALGEIVRKTAECKCVRTLQGMADCLLRSDAPVQITYTTLRQIIDQLFTLESLDVVKLSRYMRCLFQVTLPFEDDLALGLTDEYVELIAEAANNNVPLPPEETEWLATTAFNHAIDFYFAKQDELCKKWAFKAFDLAHLCGDGGRLEEMLHERFMRLKFDIE